MTVSEAYDAFGLDPVTTTPALVRATFKRLILGNHPDVVPADADKAGANDATVRLIEAYETLKAARFPRDRNAAATPAETQPPHFDLEDADFEAWLGHLKLSSLYAMEMLQNGAPVAMAHSVFMAVAGTLSGAALFAGSLWGAWNHVGPTLLVAPLGLALFLLSMWYLVSPIAYYARRDRFPRIP